MEASESPMEQQSRREKRRFRRNRRQRPGRARKSMPRPSPPELSLPAALSPSPSPQPSTAALPSSPPSMPSPQPSTVALPPPPLPKRKHHCMKRCKKAGCKKCAKHRRRHSNPSVKVVDTQSATEPNLSRVSVEKEILSFQIPSKDKENVANENQLLQPEDSCFIRRPTRPRLVIPPQRPPYAETPRSDQPSRPSRHRRSRPTREVLSPLRRRLFEGSLKPP